MRPGPLAWIWVDAVSAHNVAPLPAGEPDPGLGGAVAAAVTDPAVAPEPAAALNPLLQLLTHTRWPRVALAALPAGGSLAGAPPIAYGLAALVLAVLLGALALMLWPWSESDG